jgi:CHAT domain-containing protein
VVPPALFHSVPWFLLPALCRVPAVIAPSALMWLRAGRLPRPGRRVVIAAGPGLPGGAGEATRIAAGYPDAVVLHGAAATAEATLGALDGAHTAHIAAHGRFRADNPLFTSLTLADGPLTAYDLGRLRQAPRQLVLSSCDSAVTATVGADELLGIVSALAPLGTASLLASVVPVNDDAAGPMMAAFHARLRAGDSFGAALCATRAGALATGDPVAAATAQSFIAVGR